MKVAVRKKKRGRGLHVTAIGAVASALFGIRPQHFLVIMAHINMMEKPVSSFFPLEWYFLFSFFLSVT